MEYHFHILSINLENLLENSFKKKMFLLNRWIDCEKVKKIYTLLNHIILFNVPDEAVDHPLLDKVIFLPEKRRKKYFFGFKN